ncbi:MAG: hypothetical protein IAF58_02050 [Leptolyngbya sp.]|nr:hypothetical protein [Candidatus Melainabacteria bacterium]
MPTVNIYVSEEGKHEDLVSLLPDLRLKVAQQLTSVERHLKEDEISIRVIRTFAGTMIAPLEIEINAHAYPDRITRSDEICLRIQEFVLERVKSILDVSVWLSLSELGHSFIDVEE